MRSKHWKSQCREVLTGILGIFMPEYMCDMYVYKNRLTLCSCTVWNSWVMWWFYFSIRRVSRLFQKRGRTAPQQCEGALPAPVLCVFLIVLVG